jgi:hypothetical protein
MYRTQTSHNDCGPIAIWNALAYSQNTTQLVGIRKLIRECNPNDTYGTYPWDLTRVANYQLTGIISKRPTFKKHKILHEMNSFILLYSFKHEKHIGAHYVFVVRNNLEHYTEPDFNVYNYYDPHDDEYSHITININDFKHFFLDSSYKPLGIEYPQAWEVH